MNLGENGALPAGIHQCTINEFRETFVDGFPTTQRRNELFIQLMSFLSDLVKIDCFPEAFVDGSYVTNKVNPNDIDIVVFLHYSTVISPTVQAKINQLKTLYDPFLDIYFAVAVCDENKSMINPASYGSIINQRNYWRGQFGFDREDLPKGIVLITGSSVQEYIAKEQ